MRVVLQNCDSDDDEGQEVRAWAVVKAFMAHGHEECTTPEKTDFAGLAKVVDSCRGLRSEDELEWQPDAKGDNGFLDTVLSPAREARNGIAHSSHLELTPAKVSKFVEALQQLLDRLPLPNSSAEAVHNRDAAKQALKLARMSAGKLEGAALAELTSAANQYIELGAVAAYLRGVKQHDLKYLGSGSDSGATGGAGLGAGAGSGSGSGSTSTSTGSTGVIAVVDDAQLVQRYQALVGAEDTTALSVHQKHTTLKRAQDLRTALEEQVRRLQQFEDHVKG